MSISGCKMYLLNRANTEPQDLCLCLDSAVGAEPGETEPGSVQTQVLPVQSAGQRTPKPQEPPRRGQPALQEHAGTSGSLLRVLFPRTGMKN